MDFQEIIDHINKEENNPRLVSSIAIETKSSTSEGRDRFSVVVYTPYPIRINDCDKIRGIGRETLNFIDIVIFAALEEDGELDYVDDIIIRSIPNVQFGVNVC